MNTSPSGPAVTCRGVPGSTCTKRPTCSAVDAHRPAPADDDVDLLLAGGLLVMLGAGEARLQDELVDPEGAGAELAAHEAHGAARAGGLDLLDVDDTVAHPPESPIRFAHGHDRPIHRAQDPFLAGRDLPDRDPGPVLSRRARRLRRRHL